MRKLLVVLLMLLCMMSTTLAEEVFTEGDFAYVLTEEGAVITDYAFPDDVMERLTIPETLGSAPVVGIDESALWNEYIVYTIEIPATMTMLPEGEFGYGTEIILHPDNPHFTNEDGFLIDTRTNTLLHTSPSAAKNPLPAVTRLGNECLKNWYAEGHIMLPDTLTSIGAGVFYDCVDVTGVTIPAGVTEIGAGAFNCTSLTEIQLPPGLTSIPHLMLSCNDITEITIPESVKSIGEWAFYLCPLTRVEIPAGCEFIEYEAFDPEVELVLLGNNTHLETLEEYAERTGQDWLLEKYTLDLFEYELTDEGAVITNWNYNGYGDGVPDVVTLPAELGGQPVVGIADNALNTYEMYSEHSFTLIIPESVKYLSDFAFGCCHNATVVFFPSTLEVIPEGVFHHFDGEIVLHQDNPYFTNHQGFLVDVEKDTLLYAGPSADYYDIPAVRRLGNGSLQYWEAPDGAVVIPEGVEEIGEAVLYDWYYHSITLPESLRKIEYMGLCCMVGSPVTIPAGCTDIGDDALPMLEDEPWY